MAKAEKGKEAWPSGANGSRNSDSRGEKHLQKRSTSHLIHSSGESQPAVPALRSRHWEPGDLLSRGEDSSSQGWADKEGLLGRGVWGRRLLKAEVGLREKLSGEHQKGEPCEDLGKPAGGWVGVG